MKRLSLILLLAIFSISLTACNTIVLSSRHDHKYGPPPHAPAHGHRHKHKSGVELIFDIDLGAYIAVKYSNTYYHDRNYIRYSKGGWVVSSHHKGPWRKAKRHEVPDKLRKKKGKKQKHNKHKRHDDD